LEKNRSYSQLRPFQDSGSLDLRAKGNMSTSEKTNIATAVKCDQSVVLTASSFPGLRSLYLRAKGNMTTTEKTDIATAAKCDPGTS
jgi:hypothetical protein